MSRRMKWAIAAGVVIVALGGLKYASDQKKKNAAVEVKLEPVSRKDLVAAVTASGRIEAETQVDISADVTGRILQIAVKEGDMVKKGQFLIQIDPAQFEGAVKRAEALLSSQQASLLQAQATFRIPNVGLGVRPELNVIPKGFPAGAFAAGAPETGTEVVPGLSVVISFR